jgi:IS30 family transposase
MGAKRKFDRERIRKLLRDGVPGNVVAERMGCARKTVQRARREGGMPDGRRKQ